MINRRYYVYVYIDPRNLEEFYYGKGKGSRRYAHLSDSADSEKTNRIRAIEREGLRPVIRTVAAGLTEQEAHLIETTLIWKLGRGLTNKAAGRFVSLFRPHFTLHRELQGFDFENGIYYFNVGEGPHRNWDDCRRLGFLSAGQGSKWRDQVLDLAEGDVVVAYLKRKGYVGIGKVISRALRYSEFRCEGQLLHELNLLTPAIRANCDDPVKSEYVIGVRWIKSVSRSEAKWKRLAGLYTTQLVRASLERQVTTLAFVEKEFNVDLKALIT